MHKYQIVSARPTGGFGRKRNKKEEGGGLQGKYLSKENLKIIAIFGSCLPVNVFYIELF